jgi:hypothetical protein
MQVSMASRATPSTFLWGKSSSCSKLTTSMSSSAIWSTARLYMVSGRMGIRMDDGTEGEAGAGDVVRVEPGHDAWVVGDEAAVLIDFGPSSAYAKPQ